jgi:translation initiation factor IF-2
MRARGASITDIVVLVVAADDGIMPQTIEAIHHSQEANVPILVAINKMDLPGIQPERVRQSLTEYNLVPEEWGGDTIIVEVSAKTKAGLDDLLESILLQAEVLELKANPKKAATGTVIEARLDRGRGPVATLLIDEGTLKKGDAVVVGTAYGKVRTMFDHEGKTVSKVVPGRPVQVQGLNEVPNAGDDFHVIKNEREARKIVDHRLEELRASKSGQTARMNLEDFYERLQGVEKLELKVVVKADVQGSAEAVKQALEKLSTDKVSVTVIHHGVGAINETDVNLASASNAMMVGFNTRPDTNAKKLAQSQGVEIHMHKVIYDLTEDIQKAQVGLLPSKVKENVLGRAEVRELFTVPKVGTIAGVSVVDGKMIRGALVRLVRDSVEVHQGKMSSLKRFKEDVREVASGYECGIGLEGYNDIKRGDIIEAFELEEEQPTL